MAPGRPARGQLSHPPWSSIEAALGPGGETAGDVRWAPVDASRRPKRAWRGLPTHSPLHPPRGQAGPPEVAGGCPAPPTRPSRNQGPSQRRRGPHRGSTSRSSPGGSISWSAWQFLEPHLHLRRLSVHGCSRRVALQVPFGAPPPQRPRAHWPIAPCPPSLARSSPAFIGPRYLGAGTSYLCPRGRWSLSFFPGSGLLPNLKSNSLRESPHRVGGVERNPTQFKPRCILRRQKLKETAPCWI